MGYKGGKVNNVREQDIYPDQNSGIAALLDTSEDNIASPADVRLVQTV